MPFSFHVIFPFAFTFILSKTTSQRESSVLLKHTPLGINEQKRKEKHPMETTLSASVTGTKFHFFTSWVNFTNFKLRVQGSACTEKYYQNLKTSPSNILSLLFFPSETRKILWYWSLVYPNRIFVALHTSFMSQHILIATNLWNYWNISTLPPFLHFQSQQAHLNRQLNG